MIAVRFTADCRPWRRGDVVPLPPEAAERVIAAGDAEAATLPDAPHAEQARPAGYQTAAIVPQHRKEKRRG